MKNKILKKSNKYLKFILEFLKTEKKKFIHKNLQIFFKLLSQDIERL